MNEELQAIARRFAAAKKWTWLPGMQRVDLRHPGAWQRIITAERRTGSTYFTAVEVAPYPDGLSTPIVASWLEMDGDCYHVPDLDDELTCAGLLPVVRRAWDDPSMSPEMTDDGKWALCRRDRGSDWWSGVRTLEIVTFLLALEEAPQ